MKKVLAICLVVVMLASMCVSALAAPNGFVSSPSGSGAPTLVEFKPSNENCTAKLNITPYGEMTTLPPALQALMQKAYDSIVNAKDLTELNAALAEQAKKMKIDGKYLAVSDLFDIHLSDCDFHDGHVDFDVTLKADALKHFVGLLHMNKDSQWELITDAEVTGNGEHLKFSVENLSPFAIVVDATPTPPTGDSPMIYIFAGIMAVSAIAVVVLFVKTKKQKT